MAQSGNVHLTAIALDEKGREERRFETDLPVRAAATQIVRPAWSWPNPRLWDLGQPNLYTLALKVQGAGLDDEMKQTFGFREFWIDGPQVLPQRQRTPYAPGDGPSAGPRRPPRKWTATSMRSGGPDTTSRKFRRTSRDSRGPPDDDRMWYERADLKGWPITGVLEHFQRYAATWSDPETRERYRAAAAAQVKRYRNHPSIIMWNTSFNYAHGDEHPRIIGNRAKAWNKLGAWTDGRFPKLQEAIEVLRSLDGARPVISHHSGAVGDVYTLNFYMDLIPLQEREEWLSYWAAYGDMPFFIVEFGCPLQATYHRGRNGFRHAITSEPWAAEFAPSISATRPTPRRRRNTAR